MKTILIVLCLIALFFLFPPFSFAQDRDQAALKMRLSYLENISEISWIEYDKNTVFIGFNRRVADMKMIVHAAALNGNMAYGFGVHVWAVNASCRGWRPGDGSYYCSATARSGKIRGSNCR